METAFDEVNTFSFLHTLPSEQEEFIKQLKDASHYAEAKHTAAPVDAMHTENLEDVFSFTPLSQTDKNASTQIDDDDDNASCPSSPNTDSEQSCNDLPPSHPRGWRIMHVSPLLLSSQASGEEAINSLSHIMDAIKIEVRTRSEATPNVFAVPERMYSSLKYEMKQSISKRVLPDHTSVLMSKLEVVNPQDHFEEILKTNGQKLIKGVSEVTAMARNASDTALECKNKIQFTDVSYHHERKYFSFKLSFYDPSFNMDEAVLIAMSAPFQVFARRPTARKSGANKKGAASPTTTAAPETGAKKKEESKKRKHDDDDETIVQPPVKKMKPTVTSAVIIKEEKPAHSMPKEEKVQLKKGASLQDFVKCLDLLVAFKNSLTSEEQRVAVDVAQKRLGFSSASGSLLPKSLKSAAGQMDNMDLSALFSDM